MAYEWVKLAEGFPPGLVTNTADTALERNTTPEAYGLSMTAEGFLAPGSIPSGTTRVVRTYASVSDGAGNEASYEWHYDRLWRVSGANLIYGAPRYTAFYYRQGAGEIAFNEDSGSLTKILPFGSDSLALFKTTGAYVVRNCADPNGNFRISDFIQEAGIASATHCVELDGTAYVSTSSGVFALTEDGATAEISFPVRDQLTTAYALTADYRRKYLVCGSAWAYDVNTKRWFDYRTSGFRYRAPSLRTRGEDPMSVQALGFSYERTGTSPLETVFQVRFGARDWGDAQTVYFDDSDTDKDMRRVTLEYPDNARTFDLRITSLDSGLKLRAIYALVDNYVFDGEAE